jgi:hypothetical protein
MKKLIFYFAPAVFLMLAGIPNAHAQTPWYDTSWSNRIALTINHTKVSGTLTNFPVLINITNSALQQYALANGNDILFTSSDGTTKLPHEIESYTDSDGLLVAWVNVPTLSSAADTTLYLYYGNATTTNQQNAGGVWDSNYKGVWHLQQTPTGSAGDIKDSTSGNNAGTSHAIASGAQVPGKISGSLTLDGTNDYISTATKFTNPVNVTVEAWVKTTSTNGAKVVGFENYQFQTNTTPSVDYDRHLYIGIDGKARFGTYNTNTSTANIATSTSKVNDGQWHFLVGYRDNVVSNVCLYVDGVLQATTPSSGGQSYAGWYRIGGYTMYLPNWPSSASGYFAGSVDEVRVSHVIRSSAWVATEYINQSSPAAFYSVGSAETGLPTIITQPTDQTVVVGSNVTFTVVAGGLGSLNYQWYFNDSAISGATATNYTITGVVATNAGNYTVVIADFYGSVTSSVAVLTLFPPLTIALNTSDPAGVVVGWPAAATAAGFVLQTNDDLLTTNWGDYTGSVEGIVGTNQMTINTSTRCLFFRLKH